MTSSDWTPGGRSADLTQCGCGECRMVYQGVDFNGAWYCDDNCPDLRQEKKRLARPAPAVARSARRRG